MVVRIPWTQLRNACLALVGAYLIWLRRNWKRARALLNLPTEDAWRLIKMSPNFRLRGGVPFKSIFPNLVEWAKNHREDGLYAVAAGNPLTPFHVRMIVVCDLHLAKQILHRKSYQMFRKGWSYRLSHPLVGDGLLAINDGDEWKSMRELTNAGFKLPSMQRALGIIAQVTVKMMERWRSEILRDGPSCLDIYEESLRLTLDVLGHVAFSYDFESVTAKTPEDAPLFSAFQVILTSLVSQIKMYPLSKYLPSASNRGLAAALEKLNMACEKLVQERQTAMAASLDQATQGDVLTNLLEKDEQGHPRLKHDCIVDCMKTILFAGHDTTASALTWALHLLAVHTDWQDRLRQILSKAGFQAGSGAELPSSVTYQHLDDLEELTAVVKETLRLYPSAGFTREPVEPTTLQTSIGKEYEFFPGTELFIFPNVFHSDPTRFQDPEAFCPERWLEPSSGMKEAFLPFSLGLRNCVGERLAMAELRVALALVVTNFMFQVEDGHEKPFQVLLLSMQPYGVKLRVTAVESSME